MMNKVSYFKLPLIFISIYLLIEIGWLFIAYFIINPSEYAALLFSGNVLGMSFPLILYFVTVIFLCDKYHLYTTVTKDLSTFILTTIIFSTFSIGWFFLIGYVTGFIYSYMIEVGHYGYLTYFNIFNTILSDIVHVIILILLFKFLFEPTTPQRQPNLLDEISGKKVYASIYSLLVLMLNLFYLSISAFDAIFYFQYSFGLDMNVIMLIIIAALVISWFIHYLFVYTVTRNSFKCFDSRLKVIPLLKSLGLTFLFMLIGLLILGVILAVIIFIQLSLHSYYDFIHPTFIFGLIIVGFILSCLITFIAARLGVKCIFGAKKYIAPTISNVVETE